MLMPVDEKRLLRAIEGRDGIAAELQHSGEPNDRKERNVQQRR